MYSTVDLRLEAQEALERVWFVQSLEEIERTDLTLSLRYYYDTPDKHEPLPEGLGPRPLLEFLARVEDLLLQHDLL